MKEILQLNGLDCAACAAELERKIARLDGVKSATLTYVNQKLVVEYTKREVLNKVIDTVNNFEEVKVVLNGQKENKSFRKTWLTIAVSACFFLFGVFLGNIEGVIFSVLSYGVYIVAYILAGYTVLKTTVKNITKGKIFDENFLMTLAAIGAMCIGEFSEAVLVMLLYQIGETLQAMAVGSSRRSISDLMDLKSNVATLLKDGQQMKVKPEEIQVGDILVIKAGEKTPVDGVLLTEEAVLDMKSLTGESEYKTLLKGEEILSGSINVGGMYEMKAIRRYENSAVSKILNLVENAPSGKAESEKFITKFARIYTPVVCVLALIIAFIVPIISGLVASGNFYFKDFSRWIHSALTFLVVSCPCALVISVPLTYFSGIGTCAKQGILVKGTMYLDIVAESKVIAFDKTGTLTKGDFSVCGVHTAENVSEEEFLSIASAIEKGSSHPIAKAFSNYETKLVAKNIYEWSGKGLTAEINGEKVTIGTSKMLREQGVIVPDMNGPYTFIYLAIGKRYLGVAELGDKIRTEAKDVVNSLKNLGFSKIVMLTGDSEERAYKIANEAGMYEVNAKLLPDEKLRKAQELKENGRLIYVGDGINDAPVMSISDCAVSMGTLGSAAAVEASDMVLISDNLAALPKAVKIAKKTKSIVMQNIIFAISMKIIFLLLGLLNILPLWLAVFADVGVMLLAVCNSLRMRMIKK